jgi:exopolysaccharide biosynthesis polyprenyl glycosylphosphotransferase
MARVNAKSLEPTPEDQAWTGLSVVEKYQTSVGAGRALEGESSAVGMLSPFRRRLIISDSIIVIAVMLMGLLISSRASTWAIDPLLAVYSMPLVISLLWLGMLTVRGSYDQRVIGLGTEEIRRVISATLYTFAIVAGVSYLIRADISRAYAFVSLPLGAILIVVSRFGWRSWLYRQRARNLFQWRTIVVGTGAASDELFRRLTRDSYAGYQVVAEYPAPESDNALEGWLAGLDELLESAHAQAIAIAPSATVTGDSIRQLAWRLEGRDIDLLIAPAMMDVTGPRLSIRPAAGLPLLHLDEAALSRPQRFVKRSLDLVGSAMLIIILSPLLLGCAIAVKLTSRGPVIFRQIRIGQAGQLFTMLKFRTMGENADAQREALRAQHDLDSPMFKLSDDPRITRVGRFLRRWSLDELMQMFNVIGGAMSLVGPRPHPIDDVNRYELEAYRRLSLKPGMTGLWQVEGRSDLSWAEALQLDLYYVESWSLSGDLVLLARTVRAVIQGRGAV